MTWNTPKSSSIVQKREKVLVLNYSKIGPYKNLLFFNSLLWLRVMRKSQEGDNIRFGIDHNKQT